MPNHADLCYRLSTEPARKLCSAARLALRLALALPLALPLAAALAGCAAAGREQGPTSGSSAASPPRDAAVVAALAAVSAERIERRIRTLAAFGTRHTMSETDSPTRGIGAARRWILGELQACSAAAGGRLEVALDEHLVPAGGRIARPTPVVNVVATLPGTDPQARARMLVVSGHYDSRASDVLDAEADAPGANDDASGTAVSMELACVLATQRFPATLVFMAVAGEEQGLLGAERWAEGARRQGLRIEAMITNDIVGSPVGDKGQRDARQLRLFAESLSVQMRAALGPTRSDAGAEGANDQERLRRQLDAQLRAGGAADFPTNDLGRHLKGAGERYLPGFEVQLIQRPDRYLRGGDHLPFLQRGFAAVRFTEPFENFAHQHQNLRDVGGIRYGDLPEFVDFGYVADVARINLAGLATLALAPAAPRNVRVETTELTNDTTLQWDRATEPGVAGYRVVWRATTSPTWQASRDVGLFDRVTLAVSKDNVIFGVQALSAGGHASLATFPLPMTR